MGLDDGDTGSVEANKLDQDSIINLRKDLHGRGSGGHVLEQNSLCKQDRCSDASCHTQWFVPQPWFIATPPPIWLQTRSPCSSFPQTATSSPFHQGSRGRPWGVRWQQRTWTRGLAPPDCTLPTTPSPFPPPPSAGGANLPWKRLRARSRHEALIRHSPEWVLRTINL